MQLWYNRVCRKLRNVSKKRAILKEYWVILQEILPRRAKGELEKSRLNVSIYSPSTIVVPSMTVLLVLEIFFEGVQECIAAGVKEDEVGYQHSANANKNWENASKSTLRKNLRKDWNSCTRKWKSICARRKTCFRYYVNPLSLPILFMTVLFHLGLVDEEACFIWPAIFEGFPQVPWRSTQYADQVISLLAHRSLISRGRFERQLY